MATTTAAMPMMTGKSGQKKPSQMTTIAATAQEAKEWEKGIELHDVSQ